MSARVEDASRTADRNSGRASSGFPLDTFFFADSKSELANKEKASSYDEIDPWWRRRDGVRTVLHDLEMLDLDSVGQQNRLRSVVAQDSLSAQRVRSSTNASDLPSACSGADGASLKQKRRSLLACLSTNYTMLDDDATEVHEDEDCVKVWSSLADVAQAQDPLSTMCVNTAAAKGLASDAVDITVVEFGDIIVCDHTTIKQGDALCWTGIGQEVCGLPPTAEATLRNCDDALLTVSSRVYHDHSLANASNDAQEDVVAIIDMNKFLGVDVEDPMSCEHADSMCCTGSGEETTGAATPKERTLCNFGDTLSLTSSVTFHEHSPRNASGAAQEDDEIIDMDRFVNAARECCDTIIMDKGGDVDVQDQSTIEQTDGPYIFDDDSGCWIALGEESSESVAPAEATLCKLNMPSSSQGKAFCDHSPPTEVMLTDSGLQKSGVKSEHEHIVVGALQPFERSPVLLHVYDVSKQTHVQWLNTILANRASPVKFGGFFHVGVEVYGKEWIFGYASCGPGVGAIQPLSHPDHNFRETIDMGSTELSMVDVASVIHSLRREYTGLSYNLLSRNCCHFADALCQSLGVGSIPEWICRLANVGDAHTQVIQTLKVLAGEGVMHLSRSPAVLALADRPVADASLSSPLKAPSSKFQPVALQDRV